MSLIQQFQKELISAGFSIFLALLFYVFRSKAKLVWSSPHSFSFLLDQGEAGKPRNFLIHTAAIFVANAGRISATEIEVTFNFNPGNYNVWPPRPVEKHIADDGRFTLKFSNLAPKEHFQVELLSMAPLPGILSLRCKECVGSRINMRPTRSFSPTTNYLIFATFFMGIFAYTYVFIKILTVFIPMLS